MSDDTLRAVEIERTSTGHYLARNARGGSITVGTGGDADFSPVELLLVAIGACSAVDVDTATSRRAEPDTFTLRTTGDKVQDDTGGNRMVNLAVEFTVAFPEGPGGDAARSMLPRVLRLSHDKLCTVSRTVEAGSPVVITLAGGDVPGGPTGA